MADPRIAIYLESRDRANSALERLHANLSSIGSTSGVATRAAGALAGIGFAVYGIQQVAGAIGGLTDGLFGFNSSLEQATITYGTLLGSADAAQKRIEELTKFAALTPFDFQQVMEADRILQTFGARSLDVLTMVGDAASGTGQRFDEVAFWIGRAYSAMQAGQPFGEAAMRLQEMGILTAQGRQELDKLTEAGASSEDMWAVLTGEMDRFTGLMDKQSRSAAGLTSTLKDLFTQGIAVLTKPFFERFKTGLSSLVNYLSSPRVQNGLTAASAAVDASLAKMQERADRVFSWFQNRGIPSLVHLFKSIQPSLKIALPAAFTGFTDALANIGKVADWVWRNGIQPLTKKIGELVDKARIFGSDPRIANVAKVLGAIAAYALVAKVGLGALSLVLGPMAPLLQVVGPAMQALGLGVDMVAAGGQLAASVIGLLVSPLKYLAAIALDPFVASLSLLFTVLVGFATLNPVALTIGAIGAAIALWDKIDWGGIGEGIVELAGNIKDKLGDALDSLPELPGIIGRAIYDAIYGLVNLPNYIVESLSKLAQNLIAKLVEQVKNVDVTGIKDKLGAALGEALRALAKAPDLFKNAASALAGALITAIVNFPDAAGKVAGAIATALRTMVAALPSALKAVASDFGNTILNTITAPLGNFADPTRQFIKKGLLELFDKAGVVVSTAKSLGGRIIDSVSDGFGAVTDMALRMATFIIGQIASLLGKAGALIVSVAGAIGSKIGDWIADGLAASTSFVGRLIEIIKDALADAWDAVPKPWDLFGLGATPGRTAGPRGGSAMGGAPFVLQVVFNGPTLATEAEMQKAARMLVQPLRREFDRIYGVS